VFDGRSSGSVDDVRSDLLARVNTAQRAAIFKQAKHKEAAKLFLSWLTLKTIQAGIFGQATWSARRDVPTPPGRRPLSSYKNTNPDDFVKFMADREAVDRLRAKVQRYVGPVRGADPADPANTLGPYPGRF